MSDPNDCGAATIAGTAFSSEGTSIALGRAGGRLEELPRRRVGCATELAVELPLEEEAPAKHLRDGEDQLHVRNVGEHVFDHALRPGDRPLLAARGT
jgi:hypothetical protein